MGFIQIIDLHTDKMDELRALDDEWERASAGKRSTRRTLMTRDRDNPDHYMLIVFFDSYESAMENSELPETAALAEKMGALVSGPPTFHNLEIVDDRSD
jgi:quinol monooxygenase YgiN